MPCDLKEFSMVLCSTGPTESMNVYNSSGNVLYFYFIVGRDDLIIYESVTPKVRRVLNILTLQVATTCSVLPRAS
jgi:hypothetical protein